MSEPHPIESWLQVPDADGLYSVSDLGHIRRDRTGRVLKPWGTRGGLYVTMSIGGARRDTHVATLVARVHLGPPPWGVQRLAYRDGDPTNVRADNLRWVIARTAHHSSDLSSLTNEELMSLIRAALEESARRMPKRNTESQP